MEKRATNFRSYKVDGPVELGSDLRKQNLKSAEGNAKTYLTDPTQFSEVPG